MRVCHPTATPPSPHCHPTATRHRHPTATQHRAAPGVPVVAGEYPEFAVIDGCTVRAPGHRLAAGSLPLPPLPRGELVLPQVVPEERVRTETRSVDSGGVELAQLKQDLLVRLELL